MFNPVIARPDHPGSKIFPSFGGEGTFSEEEIERMNTLPIQESMRFCMRRCIKIAHEGGVDDDRIMLDPGIGFGLTKRENLLLIRDLHVLKDMGYCTFVGVSRKRFVVNILENAGFNMNPDTEDGHENRDIGSAALTAIATMLGADVVRVHTVSHHRMSSEIGSAIRFAEVIEDVHLKQYSSNKIKAEDEDRSSPKKVHCPRRRRLEAINDFLEQFSGYIYISGLMSALKLTRVCIKIFSISFLLTFDKLFFIGMLSVG